MNNATKKSMLKEINKVNKINSKRLCVDCKKNKKAKKSFYRLELTICEECFEKQRKHWDFPIM